MLTLNYEEKIKLMHSLNWDNLDKPEDMLEGINGGLIIIIAILMMMKQHNKEPKL